MHIKGTVRKASLLDMLLDGRCTTSNTEIEIINTEEDPVTNTEEPDRSGGFGKSDELFSNQPMEQEKP